MVNAVNLSSLVQKIQDERAAVALNIFLDRPTSDDMQDLQIMVRKGMDLSRFTLLRTFNATDTVLQNVTTWPDLGVVEFFESKLKFQSRYMEPYVDAVKTEIARFSTWQSQQNSHLSFITKR